MRRKFAPGPDGAGVELLGCFKKRHAPCLTRFEQCPVERGRAAIARRTGVDYEAQCFPQHISRNGALQKGRKDQVRREHPNGFAENVVGNVIFDADVLAPLA
jgi:hypothetical protein